MLSFIRFFLFKKLKNNPVPEPRTAHFRGLVGFEAKAKYLSFEAKAKNKDLNCALEAKDVLRTPPLDLTVMRFESQTSRSRDVRVTARPTRRYRKKNILKHIMTSSVARGGGRSHWRVTYAKSHVFGAFEADFWRKNENSLPPKEIGCRSCEVDVVIWPEKPFEFPIWAEKSVSISVKTSFFFWRSPVFGLKISFEFPISAEISVSISVKSFFFFFSFFWRSPVFGLKNRLNFRFWPKFPSQF